MPEGPEARRIADKLRERLKNKYLLSFTWVEGYKHSDYFQQTWDQVSSMFPSKCLDILTKGKQLFFFFENGLGFISSLGMSGHWYRFKTGKSAKYLQNQLETRCYAKISLQFGYLLPGPLNIQVVEEEVYYDDKLSYGNFTIGNHEILRKKMKEIGPDLLMVKCPHQNVPIEITTFFPELFIEASYQRFHTEITKKTRSHMQIQMFLMKHEYVSGIGNYLKSEILYTSRIHPERQLSSLSEEEIQRLYSVSVEKIAESYQYGGLTHGDFLDPDMQKGVFPIFVYKRNGKNDQNGFVIQTLKTKDGRTTYFVPQVQI